MSKTRTFATWMLIGVMHFSCGEWTVWAEGPTDVQPSDSDSNHSDPQQQVVAATDSKNDNQPTWPFGDAFPEATGLAFQPPYVLVKLGIAAVGSAVSGLAWVATAGSDEPAKSIWTATTSGPWTWHGWIKGEKE